MKKIALLALISSAALLACSGDDNNTNDGGPDGSTNDVQTNDVQTNDASDSGGNPAPPTLGTQVDRMGRPAINTALNHVFDTNTAAKGTAKDAYNADTNVAGWQAAYSAQFAGNLGIFDALDTVCGNQIAFAKANSYSTLAGVTADDRLYLNTAGTTCTTYLAVEANVLGITNTDCGGRGLAYDVIDATYSAVAVGAFTGVGDGISADPTKTGGTTFPYLAAAQ
ncbi:MAG TPA: DUF4331 family protein [Polyangiaceae bacterium]|jgi:hypothetical protein|nr:DUF4331 family protein [Polyangiaceae bacterium]